jgi:hypothetical protein
LDELELEKKYVQEIKYSVSDDVFINYLSDFQYFNGSIYLIDFKNNLIQLNSELSLQNSINITGNGPGEGNELSSLVVDSSGIYIFNNSKLSILHYDHELSFLKEVQSDGLWSVFNTSIVREDSIILTTNNMSDQLITTINLTKNVDDSTIHYNLSDKKFGFVQQDFYLNQYTIVSDREYLILANESQPEIILIDKLSKREVKTIRFDKIEYLQNTFKKMEEFNSQESNVNGVMILVHDAVLHNNKLYLLVITRDRRFSFSNSLIEFKVKGEKIEPSRIYQLNSETDEDVPWLTNILFVNETLIAFDAKDFNFYKYSFGND